MIFSFDHDHAVAPRALADLLGGKGAGLAEMTTTLGLPVPPGFTIAVPVCREYRSGGWPAELDAEIAGHVRGLEERMGRGLGDPRDPLLLAVRSGAPRSMPGMLDTVLNLGLNDVTVEGLAAASGDAWFAWDSYRRFLTMYAGTVLGVPAGVLPEHRADESRDAERAKAEVRSIQAALESAGHPVPADPAAQLRGAVEAVFRSWDSARARAYRAHEGIDDRIGTAVNVQAMVFGNRGADSGTGVVFTRDPSTGADLPFGDYLPCAQGEDVVSGTVRTLKLEALAGLMPEVDRELRRQLRRLEVHYRDICDVEFTVENGRLWILQTRIGKRSATAAVRAAVAMVADPQIALSRSEASGRVPTELRDRARADALTEARTRLAPKESAAAAAVAAGLGASPGRVSGRVVLSADAAAESDGDVILVRPETSPEDVHGMSVSVGLLTSRGGLASHAAVVARGWNIPAVVGADDLVIGDADVRSTGGRVLFAAGDVITIDGATGQVWLGATEETPSGVDARTEEELLEQVLPELRTLESWSAETKMGDWMLNDRTSATFPLYSRANVGEVFPDPITPLNATTGFLANLEPGWRDAFVATGAWDHDLYDPEVEHNPIVCFDGYLYINMSLMRLFGVRVPGFSPEAVDLQYFGDMPGIPSYESERRDFDESPAHSERAGAWLMQNVLGATDLSELDAEVAEILRVRRSRPDMAGLTDEQLIERITSMNGFARRMFKSHIETSLKAGIGLGAVAQVCAAIGRPELSLELLVGIGDVDSAGASIRIWELGRAVAASPELSRLFDEGTDGLLDRLRASRDRLGGFVADLESFLADWDFRGPNEWEYRRPTWGTKPELALAAIDRARLAPESDAPSRKAVERTAQRERAEAEVRAALAGNEALGQFEAALNAGKLWLRGRERTRTTGGMTTHEQRLPALELGRRAVARGHLDRPEQIFMLTIDEVPDFLANGTAWTERLRERERQYMTLFDYEPPFVVAGSPPPFHDWKRRDANHHEKVSPGAVLQGVSGCPGTVTGRARVLLTPDDPTALEVGDILIAPITDPSWTPLFMAAGGVVCDVGAPFSHAAIVSRELGIPCVVSVANATARIPDGALIEVDGTAATVRILEVA
ncbi:MAG TPA: PEP/pyruvate-binding domain-containing protein [Candidatus Dormibacteraeota bacterium]|nr:PEP/pyruvate-binding domain-containing protein [Candidatus Dormibacteraeota bacterium]